MSTSITSFENIKIASNEPIDYYTLNRVYSRLYDAAVTVSSNVNIPLSGTLPYATMNSPGFVQFTETSAVSAVYNNNIISANAMNTFMNNIALTAINTATLSTSGVAVFLVTSGGGQLFNNMKFQYGYTSVPGSARSIVFPRVGVNTVIIPFITSDMYKAFTQTPHIMYQILDNNIIPYLNIKALSHLVEVSDITVSGCTAIITTGALGGTLPGDWSLSAFDYYLTWLAIGI
jgi:hypothetical protein